MTENKQRETSRPKLVDVHYVESVLARTKIAFRIEQDYELANRLGVSPSAICDSRKRGSLPMRKLVATIVETEGEVSLDWIFGNSKSNGAGK
jgi:predicted transcriptional regulator